MSITFKKFDLFGGAFKVDLPESFVDLSQYRQIPDHQECYGDQQGLDTILVDITQRPDDESIHNDADAFDFHASDIMDGDTLNVGPVKEVAMAQLREAIPARIGFIYSNPNPNGKYQGILLLLVRLETELTDLVISIVMPEMDVTEDAIQDNEVHGSRHEKASAVLARFIGTFEIRDFKLFIN